MGWRNSQVLACDRRLLRGGDFHALDHWSPGECEGGRQAKVGENATGGLQHMGALRPDLPIEAMIKIKNGGRGVRGNGTFNRQRLRHDSQSDER
jgi:hypothetical protein